MALNIRIFPSHPLLILYVFSDHRKPFMEMSYRAIDLLKSYQLPGSKLAFLSHIFPYLVSHFQKIILEISTFVDFHSK